MLVHAACSRVSLWAHANKVETTHTAKHIFAAPWQTYQRHKVVALIDFRNELRLLVVPAESLAANQTQEYHQQP